MKTLVVILSICCAVQAIPFFDFSGYEWEIFKVQHGKKYEDDIEETFRKEIFMENRNEMLKHNARYERGEVSYRLELNQFADLLVDEFASTVNGYNRIRHSSENYNLTKSEAATFISPAHVQLPAEVDWRKAGAVTEVKNQGRCGSCWSFSATGALEGQHFRKTGVLVSLSEQNLIDCSGGKYHNHGCHGGLMDRAFQYIKENRGIDTESSYPYQAAVGYCRYNPESSGATDVGFVDLPEGDEEKLKEAVATVGPISVGIDAGHKSFQLYRDGIYYEPSCSSSKLDHGVLVVGYGTTNSGEDYWIVKNSWSSRWGDKGYIKMARNRDNNCGIATQASYPLV